MFRVRFGFEFMTPSLKVHSSKNVRKSSFRFPLIKKIVTYFNASMWRSMDDGFGVVTCETLRRYSEVRSGLWRILRILSMVGKRIHRLPYYHRFSMKRLWCMI